MRRFGLVLLSLPLLLHASTFWARATTLTSSFDQILRFGGDLDQRFRQGLETVLVTFERNAGRTADFPATATTSGYAYEWDPTLGAFKRVETSRGSVYIEPAGTVGYHRVQLSVAYLYANLTKLDGESLTDSLDSALHQSRGGDTLDIATRTLALRSQVFTASATFGLTDRWDVNLLLPVFLTTLELAGESALLLERGCYKVLFDWFDRMLNNLDNAGASGICSK